MIFDRFHFSLNNIRTPPNTFPKGIAISVTMNDIDTSLLRTIVIFALSVDSKTTNRNNYVLLLHGIDYKIKYNHKQIDSYSFNRNLTYVQQINMYLIAEGG